MPQQQPQTFFKRGELNFKQILYEQLNRVMEALTKREYLSFMDGVEGLYLLLFYYLDNKFTEEDDQLFKVLGQEKPKIESDIRLIPEEKESMLTGLGIHIAKKRL